jgi:gluconolactonase
VLLDAPLEPLVGGYQSLEGPAFGQDGGLYFVDWLAHSVQRLGPDGRVEEWFNTGGIPAGLAFDRDGGLCVADEGERIHGVIRLSATRELTVLADSYQGQPLNGANDLVFDRRGVLYFSDPWRSSRENPIGGFYRLFPDGRLERLDGGLAFPNGVALAAPASGYPESAAFLAETGHRRILRYPIGSDGRVGEREEWARLDGRGAGPDGMAFDQAGRLYVAHFGAGTVDVFDQEGRLAGTIGVPGRQVTNVAFGGPDGRTLVVTECETGTLYRGRASVPGLQLFGGTRWGD